MSSTRNLSRSSAAHAGSSVRLLMATFVPDQSSVVLSCRRMSLAAPRSTTRSPDCESMASPSGVNGAPPRHDNMYISGSQRQPSRSNTTTLGLAARSVGVRRAVCGCMKALQSCRCSTSAAMACFMVAHCSTMESAVNNQLSPSRTLAQCRATLIMPQARASVH